MFKQAQKGTYHKMSPKHLQRYGDEFAGRHNVRERDTIEQIRHLVAMTIGRALLYKDLISDNGLESGARC